MLGLVHFSASNNLEQFQILHLKHLNVLTRSPRFPFYRGYFTKSFIGVGLYVKLKRSLKKHVGRSLRYYVIRTYQDQGTRIGTGNTKSEEKVQHERFLVHGDRECRQ